MPVSVIIPVLNEEAVIGRTLRLLSRQEVHEIIVVDGGSHDATVARSALADRVITFEPGRGRQMNAGARVASGDCLLFLHADCRLDDGAVRLAERLLRRPRIAAGCFRQRVDQTGLPFRWIDGVATARVRLLGTVYGDQGLFVRRELFERVGGFPEVPLFEDVLLSRRLRRHGRIVVANRRIHVSPRRWNACGLFNQTVRNWSLIALAASGVPLHRLGRFYPAVR